MQELGDHTIQRVDWQNVCPVVLLPRAYRYALGVRAIVLAFVGLMLTSFFAYFFLPNSRAEQAVPPLVTTLSDDTSNELLLDRVAVATDRIVPEYEDMLYLGTPRQWHENVMTFTKQKARENTPALVPERIAHPWVQLSAAGFEVFSHRHNSLLKSLGWFAVVLIIWGLIGGMITRIVALRFAQDRRESFSHLLAFAQKKWLSYIGAMILPVLGIFCALIPVWLLGMIWQAVGESMNLGLIYSIGGFIHLILTFPFALVAVLIMIGFIFGWPLMFAAISAEGSDAFDAVSRGFSYVYQRPVQFVFYHICNLAIYAIGIIIANFVFYKTIKLIGYDPTGLMIVFNSFAFAYFWSSSTVIYFLLRRSCDATPFDQVWLGKLQTRTLQPFSLSQSMENVESQDVAETNVTQ